jgi:hypothetical protein
VAEVNGAISYTWTLPAGWTGTSSTNVISTIAGPISGNVTVTANNSCGSSLEQTLAATVNVIPTLPTIILGKTDICANSSNTYRVDSVSGATHYTWTLPAGWTGNSTTNNISAVSNSIGGIISVTANSTCGISAVQTLNVTVSSLPNQPASISGNAVVCANSSNVYQVAVTSGVTSYTWTLPPGWTGISTTNSISTVASNTNGNITVAANNGCGSSQIQTLAITVNSLPSQPSGIIGNTSVCPNSMNDYSIDAVPGASFYSWIMPAGWTINSTSNSISTVSGSLGGTIMVSTHNSCGSSSPQTLPVQITQVNKSVTQSGNTLTAAAADALYQWINCNSKEVISGQTNQNFTTVVNGNYAVIVKVNNCTDTSSCFALGSVPIHDSEGLYKINVFPNPTHAMMYVELKDIHKGKLEVYNALGKMIYSTFITSLKTKG